VTMAAGFSCSGGVILCADSEVGTNIEKWIEPKILSTVSARSLAFAVTGAGSWDYVKMAGEKLISLMVDLAEPTEDSTFKVVEQTVQELYAGPIASFSGYEKPSFDLIAAVRTRDMPCPGLIRSSDTAIRRGERYELAGTGCAIGKYLADKLYRPTMSLEEGAALAAYILRESAESARGVGAPFLILSMDCEGLSEVSDLKLAELNASFLLDEKPAIDLENLAKNHSPILRRFFRGPG
jgi:hypothetical protein